ncbi:PqiC family protein [Paraburkholderia phosphatilytica]|uniref:PqiC family protein n=1 Tax=Paraburkholderia phosphatilytica TaxID=2282883 RepID=UPI000E480B31|nr:PqiC family protein [Paraburkholderia phosphatilytica]
MMSVPRVTSRLAACAAFAALGLLAACASPASHFYTLSADSAPAAQAASAARTATHPSLLIEVPPIDVPAQVAKYQFVVQTAPTQVDVLEQQRWASLPSDEIRRALSADLTQQLDTIDVYGTAYPQGMPVYRVSVNVQRFESWPGSHALIDAVWSVRAVKTDTVMTCRSTISEPVQSGYDALVDGHRRAVAQISTEIAAAVRELASAPQPMAPMGSSSSPGKSRSAAPVARPQPVLPCPTEGAAPLAAK